MSSHGVRHIPAVMSVRRVEDPGGNEGDLGEIRKNQVEKNHENTGGRPDNTLDFLNGSRLNHNSDQHLISIYVMYHIYM